MPGGTGKSTLNNLITSLLSKNCTKVSTLKALNKDQFEIYGLRDKKLVIVNDTEVYSNHVSVIKAITGCESLRGRIMHKGETVNVTFPGLLIITDNRLLNTRDASNAILRRMRPIKAETVVKNRKNLISTERDELKGDLASELPGILYKNYSYIGEFEKQPVLAEALGEARELVNPIFT